MTVARMVMRYPRLKKELAECKPYRVIVILTIILTDNSFKET
jgi:hypothetical protein